MWTTDKTVGVPANGRAASAASCQQQFGRLRPRIESEDLLALGFQEQLDGVLEVGQTFLAGFALSVRTGNFEARRPKAPSSGSPRCTMAVNVLMLLF